MAERILGTLRAVGSELAIDECMDVGVGQPSAIRRGHGSDLRIT